MEQKKSTKYILIAISVLFIFVMLILPLFSILFSALKEGFAFYIQAVTTEYVRSALLVTLLATVIAVIVNTFFGIMAAWLLTKFSFRGKQVLATLIDIPFSISPVIVGLAFCDLRTDSAGRIRQSGRSTSFSEQTSALRLRYRVWCLPQFLSLSRLYRVRSSRS